MYRIDDLKNIPLPIGKAKYIIMDKVQAPIIEHCMGFETRDRIYHMYADTEEEIEAWCNKITQALTEYGHNKRYRLQTLRESEKIISRPDMSGEWVLDSKASESVDPILKAIGK